MREQQSVTPVFGKFRILAELGHGGMADVFLAMIEGPQGSRFAKLAVIKRLRQNLAEDPEFISMLVDEARITARLNHPNVVQTLEVGTVGEEYYLAMEYLDGQPLHRIQRRAARQGSPLSVDLEYLVVLEALAGLHHAHELTDYDGTPLDVVHRDVTPQNLFVTYDGQVKVVDFGIAKAQGRAAETRQGIVKGKVRYMSPEQAIGQAVDRRADVFAAGILLWEAATGRRMWGDKDDLSIVQALIGEEYSRSPRDIDPDVPEAIDAICRRALAHDIEARYASAAEMRADLESFIADRMMTSRRQLGATVAELFAPERQQIREIIERAGRAHPATSEAPSHGFGSLVQRSSGTDSRRTSTTPVAMTTDRSSAVEPSSRPQSSRAKASAEHGDDPTSLTEVSLLGFIPRRRRFGAGLVFGSATMLASTLLALVALRTIESTPVAAAALPRSPRSVVIREALPSDVVRPRRPSTVEKTTAEVAPADAASIRVRASSAPARTFPVASVAAPPALTPAPSLAGRSRRRARTIDMNDPWAP